MVNLYNELHNDYLEVSAKEFYRDIFPQGELDERDKFTKGKYTAIACEFCNEKKSNGKQLIKRYSITDDLEEIDSLLESENFIIISPISYYGKSRKTENARVMYALGVELDGLRIKESGEQVGYNELKYEFSTGYLPTPNYIVASGNGLHLYYIFEKPLMLFDNVKKSLMNYKREITRKLWNKYTTIYHQEEKIQYESAFQGFRLVGGVSKKKERTKAFRVSEKHVDIEYLNKFVTKENEIEIAYKSELTLAEAKEKYPKWYQDRIVDKKPKGSWIVKRDLYDWWLREIKKKRTVGHRYYCMMILCIYAIKCDISSEELERDCYSLLELFDNDSYEENNRFTEKDIADALQAFEDKTLVTYPINIISKRSGIDIKRNKRNGRKQSEHIKLMNFIRDEINGNRTWYDKSPHTGRKTKEVIIKEWQKNNPKGKPKDCILDTGLNKNTVYKWWNK